MRIKIILSLLFAAISLMSCNTDAILDDFTFEPSVVNYQQGDTSVVRRSLDSNHFQRFNDIRNSKYAIVLHDTIVKFEGIKLHGKPTQAPDLSNLKTDAFKGKPLEYVAFGSSLTAGVRDGGYYNEAILTAYPELIARQMRLENFISPVFESSDYNGIGRKVFTEFNPTQGPIKKYAVVTNNTGIEKFDEKTGQFILKKSKYKWEELNNAAIPGIRFSVSYPEYRKSGDIYAERLGKDSTMFMNIGSRELDFFTYESNSADFSFPGSFELQGFFMSNERLPSSGEFNNANYIEGMMKVAQRQGLKGVFINIPNHNYFPAYWQVPCGLIEKNSYNLITSKECENGFIYGNSSILDTLASPIVSLNLKTADRIPNSDGQYNISYNPNEEIFYFDHFNKTQLDLGKKYGFPVLELDRVYEEILDGKYITDDGIKADPRMEGGNFFSSDGLYPTAFGHAIIANEIIKVINGHYKTRIPLINTREYLK